MFSSAVRAIRGHWNPESLYPQKLPIIAFFLAVALVMLPGLVLGRVVAGRDLLGPTLSPILFGAPIISELGPLLIFAINIIGSTCLAIMIWVFGRLGTTSRPSFLDSLRAGLVIHGVPTALAASFGALALPLAARGWHIPTWVFTLVLVAAVTRSGVVHFGHLATVSTPKALVLFMLALGAGTAPLASRLNVAAFEAQGPSMDPSLCNGDLFVIQTDRLSSI